MKLTIDIPESIIEHIKDGSFGARPDDRYALVTAVMNGTPTIPRTRILTKEELALKILLNKRDVQITWNEE